MSLLSAVRSRSAIRTTLIAAFCALIGGATVVLAQRTNYLGTVFIADTTTPTQQLKVNADGSINAVISGGIIINSCGTLDAIAYYSANTTLNCATGITATNTALTLGSGVTFTAPDSGNWSSGGISALTHLSVLATVAATVATDQAQASGGSVSLAFASTSGISAGQIAVGTSIPVGTQVASIVSNAQVIRAATGTTTSAGKLVDFSSTTGFAVGQQCTDTTSSTAIGAGNLIASIQAGVSITLTSNLVGTVTSGDSITCDPVVTLTNATSAAIAAAASIVFNTTYTSVSPSSNIYDLGGLSVVGNINTTGVITSALNGAPSAPSVIISGSVYTGGSGTTTEPLVLIQPTGTSGSSVWNTNGTVLGINAVSAFAGRLVDFQVNGNDKFFVNSGGTVELAGNISSTAAGNALEILTINSSSSAAVGLLSIVGGSASSSGAAGSINITAGAGTASSANGGSVVITAGTSAGGTAGNIQLVNLGSAALGTAYLCWNSSGNIVSEDTTCTASAKDAKNPLGTISGREALLAISQLPDGVPVWTYNGDEAERIHAGLYADDLAPLMPHCALYEHGKLHGYEDHCVIGFAFAALKELKLDFDEYRRSHP